MCNWLTQISPEALLAAAASEAPVLKLVVRRQNFVEIIAEFELVVELADRTCRHTVLLSVGVDFFDYRDS